MVKLLDIVKSNVYLVVHVLNTAAPFSTNKNLKSFNRLVFLECYKILRDLS